MVPFIGRTGARTPKGRRPPDVGAAPDLKAIKRPTAPLTSLFSELKGDGRGV
jgi:hypothetical protein